MANILVLTTDLPFFPGKNGHDFFNLQYIAQHHTVGVVGPQHPHYPAEGIANLERFLSGSYFWPRPIAQPAQLPQQNTSPSRLLRWLEILPFGVRKHLLFRLIRLHRQPPDAYEKLATLANCAPHLLRALADRRWELLVLIQSNTEPWLDYLPAQPAKLIYFHDVRADYLQNQGRLSQNATTTRTAIQAIFAQEQRCCNRSDAVGFVSDLDLQRAQALFRPTAEVGVAPIPVDTDYYTPPPPGWRKDGRPIVLFTGHLGHPPNVDAVAFFLESIWPLIREKIPEAVFQVAGLMPSPQLQQLCAAAAGVELHPNVPDIRPLFWNAAVYVVPMRFGGGVRQKIFEAWSMEVPVVCTTMATEGTRASNGQNCWLADEPSSFAAKVIQMLLIPDHATTTNAKATVMASNSILTAAPRFAELAQRTIAIKSRRPFRLLFDLRWMQIGKAGGQEQMTYELVSEISKLDHRNEYRILCPRSTFYEWQFPAAFRCQKFFTDTLDRKYEALQASLSNQLAKSVGRPPVLTPEMRALRLYNRLDFDVVHSICSYSHPDLRAFPQILTMHDLQHRHFPEFFLPEDWTERDNLYRQSAEQATHILCISEFTRQDLHQQYGVPLAKMTTVWNIPSRAAWLKLEDRKCRSLLTKMGICGRYLFFPAHGWPHKNHRRLVEAFQQIVAELPADIKLVLCGKPFAAQHPARLLMQERSLHDRIVHLGYRSPIEVRALYSGAHALVFPSLFEGFGMPVAEAIIADCPVACSQTTSLPEIGGDAAHYFDPKNVTDIARGLLLIATDEKLRANLVAAAHRRKTVFSARLSAVKTLSVYQSVFKEIYTG